MNSKRPRAHRAIASLLPFMAIGVVILLFMSAYDIAPLGISFKQEELLVLQGTPIMVYDESLSQGASTLFDSSLTAVTIDGEYVRMEPYAGISGQYGTPFYNLCRPRSEYPELEPLVFSPTATQSRQQVREVWKAYWNTYAAYAGPRAHIATIETDTLPLGRHEITIITLAGSPNTGGGCWPVERSEAPFVAPSKTYVFYVVDTSPEARVIIIDAPLVGEEPEPVLLNPPKESFIGGFFSSILTFFKNILGGIR